MIEISSNLSSFKKQIVENNIRMSSKITFKGIIRVYLESFLKTMFIRTKFKTKR